jgi:hypothetical protein
MGPVLHDMMRWLRCDFSDVPKHYALAVYDVNFNLARRHITFLVIVDTVFIIVKGIEVVGKLTVYASRKFDECCRIQFCLCLPYQAA